MAWGILDGIVEQTSSELDSVQVQAAQASQANSELVWVSLSTWDQWTTPMRMWESFYASWRWSPPALRGTKSWTPAKSPVQNCSFTNWTSAANLWSFSHLWRDGKENSRVATSSSSGKHFFSCIHQCSLSNCICLEVNIDWTGSSFCSGGCMLWRSIQDCNEHSHIWLGGYCRSSSTTWCLKQNIGSQFQWFQYIIDSSNDLDSNFKLRSLQKALVPLQLQPGSLLKLYKTGHCSTLINILAFHQLLKKSFLQTLN